MQAFMHLKKESDDPYQSAQSVLTLKGFNDLIFFWGKKNKTQKQQQKKKSILCFNLIGAMYLKDTLKSIFNQIVDHLCK